LLQAITGDLQQRCRESLELLASSIQRGQLHAVASIGRADHSSDVTKISVVWRQTGGVR